MLTSSPPLPAGCGAALEVALNGQQYVALGAPRPGGAGRGALPGAAWFARSNCTDAERAPGYQGAQRAARLAGVLEP